MFLFFISFLIYMACTLKNTLLPKGNLFKDFHKNVIFSLESPLRIDYIFTQSLSLLGVWRVVVEGSFILTYKEDFPAGCLHLYVSI
jgi:hypothetical protein